MQTSGQQQYEIVDRLGGEQVRSAQSGASVSRGKGRGQGTRTQDTPRSVCCLSFIRCGGRYNYCKCS